MAIKEPRTIVVKKQENSDVFDIALEGIVNARKFDFYVTDNGNTLHIYDVVEDRSIVLSRDGKWDIE
jgi:hypothetical protein